MPDMNIRGWIYVLSNQAMPGLVKIGFSTKDPMLRVQELSGTGLPYAFHVEYDALVHDPRAIEQQVHQDLAAHREAKEFFRIDVSTAVAVIRAVAAAKGKKIFAEQCTESFSGGEVVEKGGALVRCRICRTGMPRSSLRCPKCFALVRD
jgi:T5orf172 domain